MSDSSFRFERGIDPEAVLLSSARAVHLLLEVDGGKADEGVVSGGSIPNFNRTVEMRPERCHKLLGMEVPNSATLLARLGLKSAGENSAGGGAKLPAGPGSRGGLDRRECVEWPESREIPSRLFGSATESSAADCAHDDLMRLRQKLARSRDSLKREA